MKSSINFLIVKNKNHIHILKKRFEKKSLTLKERISKLLFSNFINFQLNKR